MAPSVNDFSESIRPVKKGDILIDNNGLEFEVVEPNVIGHNKVGLRFKGGPIFDIHEVTAQCVEVVRQTVHGKPESTRLFPRYKNMWREIILAEKRTDLQGKERK